MDRNRSSRNKDTDSYLSALSTDQRAALEKLRKLIKSVAPAAQECISYQMPAFRYNGLVLVIYGAARQHLSLFPMGGELIERFAAELADFSTSRGTIRFTPEKPLPAALVRKIVRARMGAIAATARESRARVKASRRKTSKQK
ncbi:MAG: DUF1801 domain-containing protein [Planctomycetes bacterium]|nr:DUF1801 domain-containing protein [Planctomycetota bacterium]